MRFLIIYFLVQISFFETALGRFSKYNFASSSANDAGRHFASAKWFLLGYEWFLALSLDLTYICNVNIKINKLTY